MKTRRETTAEIASDVRKATRERAEADIAEEKALKCELEKEERAKQKLFHEKFADFYLKLAILSISSSIITCLTLFTKGTDIEINWLSVGIGLSLALIFVMLAYYYLKR